MKKRTESYFKLNEAIPYRSLSGSELEYDQIVATLLKSGNIELKLSVEEGCPYYEDLVITVDLFKCPDYTVALKQNAPCKQIYPMLVNMGVLSENTVHKPIQARFIPYKLYNFHPPISNGKSKKAKVKKERPLPEVV